LNNSTTIPGLAQLFESDLEKVAFAYFRDPEDGQTRVWACLAESLVLIPGQAPFQSQLGELNGFWMFPFDPSQPGYFLPETSVVSLEVLPKGDLGQSEAISSEDVRHEKHHYEQIVAKAVASIQSGLFKKLVVSRKENFPFSARNMSNFLDALLEKYPQANFSCFHIPGKGTWVSVSPELLAGFTRSTLKTMALAGTRFWEPERTDLNSWMPKEQQEQELVSVYIREALSDLGLGAVKEEGPYSVQAGHLMHLRTDFQVKASQPETGLRLALRIHPTPAVCGIPEKNAMTWLRKEEGYDRGFFSGFSGYISENQSRFVVNLRTACFQYGKISLFAGAGITALSNPEAEWEETSSKLKTLKAFLPSQME
jgi:isochorismate synthase